MKHFIITILLSTATVYCLTSTVGSNDTSVMPSTTLTTTLLTSTGTVSIPGTSITTGGGGTVSVVLPAKTTILVPNSTAAPVVAGEYRLRSQVSPGSVHGDRFDGLYFAAWSTVPNISADAVLVKNKTQAAKFFLNGTFEQADFGYTGVRNQWSMNVDYVFYSARWYTVALRSPRNSGYGTFFVNQTGLQWTPNETPPPHDSGVVSQLDDYFGGWMACDWWHGVPQLFYKIGFYNDTRTPNGCADVLLVPQYQF